MASEEEIEVCTQVHHHDDSVRTAEAQLPSAEELSALSELFKVFGDATRLQILYLLSGKELCVCDIAAALGMSQPGASYQLKVLRQSRLVRSRKEGKTVFYALADSHVAAIIGTAKEHLEEK